jgi:thymidylate synthase
MHIKALTIDDLMRSVFKRLLKSDIKVSSSKGKNREVMGALLELEDPRSRISRTEKKGTFFSCLGELLWYLSGTNSLSFISHYLSRYSEYSDDGKTVYGAYGPRLFGKKPGNQFSSVCALLRQKENSRQAVMQLFDAEDLEEEHEDVPCTCTIQILIRNKRLHMYTTMRSNDAYWGLPHDVFAFTMIQEIMANTLGIGLGTYRHAVGSLHLYDKHRGDARRFLQEGWQDRIAMPPMPKGDPWPSIQKLLKAERDIRLGRQVRAERLKLDPYWLDLVRMLQIFKTKNEAMIRRTRKGVTFKEYRSYIDQKTERARQNDGSQAGQLSLLRTQR